MDRRLIQGFKRKLVQICAFGFTNGYPGNFSKGKLYTGKWKQFCVPGLNCYSCPAATAACPIGALQAVSSSPKYRFSFYAMGFLLAFGVLLGRFVCGWLCPFGLLQELLYKIPSKKFRLPRWCRYIKYAVLVVFVLVLPVWAVNFVGMGKPAFCQYLCPQGTLEGGISLLLVHPELRGVIGWLFHWKLFVLLVVLAGAVLVERFFCKVLCPLGAIYGLLNKVSFLRLHLKKEECISCGICGKVCPMEIDPVKELKSAECIRCGKCISACPKDCLSYFLYGKSGEKSWRKRKNKH